jgi:hypothetical protein
MPLPIPQPHEDARFAGASSGKARRGCPMTGKWYLGLGDRSMRRRLFAHQYRRPIGVLAAGLIVLQALLASLAVAQAALISADPVGVVICHGGGGNNGDDGTAPDPIKEIHQCCLACVAGSPTATLPQQTLFFGFELPPSSTRLGLWLDDVPTADRSIRAGQSRAPPRRG